MSDGKIAYEKTEKWEGYVLEAVAGDPGGETMAGITRKYESMWIGWQYVESIKDKYNFSWSGDMSKKKEMQREIIADPNIRRCVIEYYDTLFRTYDLDKINSQAIANQIFQAIVNCGPRATRWAQDTANRVIEAAAMQIDKLVCDGEIGKKTIAAINKISEKYEGPYTNIFRDIQVEYYETRVARCPTMEKFLAGWKNRAEDFAL